MYNDGERKVFFMTKLELITRIIDRFDGDVAGTCPFEFEHLDHVDLAHASEYLMQERDFEESADLDQDDRLPEEVTPELYMEAMNCYIFRMKHECTVLRLSKYIEDNALVCEYENYYGHEDGTPDVFPTDFLYNEYRTNSLPIEAGHPIDVASFVRICQNSTKLDLNDEFCYYDSKTNSLISTDNPFKDGIYDAREFAEFILSDEGQEALDYIFNDIMDEDDQADVFRTDLFQVRQ